MIRKLTYLSLFLLVLSSACSKYQRLLKSQDYEEKYQMAMVYYEQKDYQRALELFEQLMPLLRGTDRAERLSYYYAYAHYNLRDYVLGSFYFKRFVKTFPRSALAEECAYMSAYCQYLDSPRSSLDQSNTKEAIKELQLFINAYPSSTRVAGCNKLIDDLRAKLELKDMDIARLYLRMENYVAAVTAFKNVLKDYPDTRFREEAMMNILRANYYYAINSIEQKKAERLKETIASYDNFAAQFPTSRFSREASGIQQTALRQMKQL